MNTTIPAVRPPNPPDGTGPAREPRWTRSDVLELGAYPSAVTSARLHCRAILAEWDLACLGDDCETVLGELMANSIEAHEREHLDAPVRLTLLGNRDAVLIVVRDASDRPPSPSHPGLDDETGRGLLIVAALSSHWDFKRMPGGGKVTRALLEAGNGEAPGAGE